MAAYTASRGATISPAMEDCEQNSPFIAREHMLNHVFRELHGTRAVQVHHVQFGIQICFGKKPTDTDACIYASDVNASSQRMHLIPKLFHAVPCR